MNVNAQQNTETISVPAKKKKPSGSAFLLKSFASKRSDPYFIIYFDCCFAPLISPFGSLQIDPANRLAPPSGTHWFGTDNFGRDVFSRTMYGVRISLMIGAAVTIIATVLGLIVGLLSSYYKILDYILMRICDGLFAFRLFY